MLGIALLYMLLVIKLFNKINLGIGLLKIASSTTYSLNQVKKLPIILIIFGFIVGGFFIEIIINVFSVGEIKIIDAIPISFY